MTICELNELDRECGEGAIMQRIYGLSLAWHWQFGIIYMFMLFLRTFQ